MKTLLDVIGQQHCHYKSLIQIIFHGLFRNTLRCRILVPAVYTGALTVHIITFDMNCKYEKTNGYITCCNGTGIMYVLSLPRKTCMELE